MDPDSYKDAKLGRSSSHGSSSEPDIDDADSGRGGNGEEDGGGDVDAKEWDYIRVDGLGFVPGLCCPHHDRVQSNGILRAKDFDDMMLRHPTEVGICIDHNAAFMIDRSTYRVLRPHKDAGLPGSVMDDGSFSEDRIGKPGVWIKEVLGDKDALRAWLCPESGKIDELLRVPENIMPSVRHMKVATISNPDDGPLRASYPGFMTKSFFGGIVSKDYLDALLEEDDAVVDDDKPRE